MYKKIVKYNCIQFMEDASKCELIKEIESTKEDLFDYNLSINEKTYRVCSGSPKQGIIGVEEIELNDDPEIDVRNDNGLECPFCKYVDHDAFELEEDKDVTECSCCGSEIKYVRSVITNTLDECLEVIYHSGPVKLKEPIKL